MTSDITVHHDTDRPPSAASGPWNADSGKSTSRLRATGRRRSVPHLVLGLLLVLACTAVSLLVSFHSGDRIPVLALARPVAVGHVLTDQDLRPVDIAIDTGMSFVDEAQAATVVGKTMSTSLSTGALLTPNAVGVGGFPPAGQAIAALSVKSGQFPPEISPGAHVSLVFAANPAGNAVAGPPTPGSTVGWPAVVTGVSSPPSEQGTVVSVLLGETAARQIAAVPAGQVAIVLLSVGGR